MAAAVCQFAKQTIEFFFRHAVAFARTADQLTAIEHGRDFETRCDQYGLLQRMQLTFFRKPLDGQDLGLGELIQWPEAGPVPGH